MYQFSEGDKDQKDLLGGKGANLAEMTRLGLPVPPGFTITTEACRHYLEQGRQPDQLRVQVTMALRSLEDEVGRRLGDSVDPLLVSVRSGAKYSMPGMMETVLNVGLNDHSVVGLVEASGRRAVRLGLLPPADPDVRQDGARAWRGRRSRPPWTRPRSARASRRDVELDAEDLKELVEEFKGDRVATTPAASSRRTRASSWTWPPRRSSTPGTPTGPGSTGAASASRTTWAPR